MLMVLLAANSAFADAYKWTDKDGVIHYSDRPHPGAERVDLGKAQPRSPVAASRRSASAATTTDAPAAAPFQYESLEVAVPSAEDTLWNIEGVLDVSLALSPGLQPGHQVRVYFDGTAQAVSGTSFRLEEVYRGVHNLQAEVLDETGKLMIRSLPNRFYVQQNTVY